MSRNTAAVLIAVIAAAVVLVVTGHGAVVGWVLFAIAAVFILGTV